MKATVRDIRLSRFPNTIGACSNDTPRILSVLNECIQRLIMAAGETGWSFGWAKAWFNVSRLNPYLTLPRQFARLIGLDVCREPIVMHNEFYEYLPGGVGLKGVDLCQADWCGNIDGFERGTVWSMVDLTAANQYIRVYLTDSRDVGKRVLFQQAADQNALPIYTQDGTNMVDGFYVTLASPFADYVDPSTSLPIIVTKISALQKDQTYGDIVVKQVDATTGVEVTLSRYAPDETNPAYRRYYISSLPSGCCGQTTTTAIVSAIAKLEFIPVARDTDQLLIGNIPALIEEAQALRYSVMDVANAAGLEAKHHAAAVRLLQNEERHYQGEQQLAVSYNVYGPKPSRHGIGFNI